MRLKWQGAWHSARLLIVVLLCASASNALAQRQPLRLATTTSVVNSGLLEQLLPNFERAYPYDVQVLNVGSGRALRLGQRGDVDVIISHSRDAEVEFVAAGDGIARTVFMFNYFLIVGPAQDSAGVREARSAAAAMASIDAAQQRFISRGDNSGTHTRELNLWHEAHIQPQGRWYLVTGRGMGSTLQMASELSAYTLSDQGTWLNLKHKLDLARLYAEDDHLYNPYAIVRINPARQPDINHAGARALELWLLTERAQHLIDSYRIDGENVFFPRPPS